MSARLPCQAVTLTRHEPLFVYTCLQKLVGPCHCATVQLKLAAACRTDKQLSTFYFHRFMLWMSECACLMGSLFFSFLFFFFLSWCPRQWTMAKLLSSDPTQPKGFPPQLGPPNTIWHATTWGGGRGGGRTLQEKQRKRDRKEPSFLSCQSRGFVSRLTHKSEFCHS